jgi:hypothetical protein
MWQGGWVYNATRDEERIIQLFQADQHRIIPEWEFTTEVVSSDEWEIWSLWPPSQVHDAINMAVRDAWKAFPRVVTHERLVVQEDVSRYDLDTGSLNPFTADDYPQIGILLSLWIEMSRNKITGDVTAGDSTYVDDTTMDSPDTTAGSDWFMSIYKGTGGGQLRELDSVSSDGRMTPDQELATNPDTTSGYALWDAAKGEQEDDWYKVTAVRLDQLEYPNVLYLLKQYPAAKGLRFRLHYVAGQATLDVDAAETYAPQEYVVFKALSYLYDSLVSDHRVDRQGHGGLAEYYDQLARTYLAENKGEMPAITLWTEEEATYYAGITDESDPLGWG